MNLRPYQDEALREVYRELMKHPILVSPTGSGKTVMATHMVNSLNAKTLWVAHRRELIMQAASHLTGLGMYAGVILAGYPEDLFAKVHVASVATLANREMPDGIQLVVIDECHHANAESYRRFFELGVPVIGLTATPFRLDGRPLGDLFGAIVSAAQPADLIRDGFLVEPKVFSPPPPSLSRVKVTAGDYNLGQLSQEMRRPELVGDIVREWMKRARLCRTVCFATNVKHSEEIVEGFRAMGITAAHIGGGTPAEERDEILAKLASREIQVVSNCQVLTEGWDLPSLECAIIARPTKSLCLHLQMLGRVVRSAPGKMAAIVLDHAGNHFEHGPLTRRLEYRLEGEPRVVGEQDVLGLRRCEACGLMFSLGSNTCPDCGHEHEPSPRELRVVDGDLVEFEETSYAYRDAFWKQTEATREAKGYKEGWSLFRYEERFGERPFVIDGELVNREDDSQENKRWVYEHFVDVALAKGYRQGWSAHRFKQVFDCWPRGFVTDVRNDRGIEEITRKYHGG